MTIKLSFEGVFESHITVDVPVDEVAFRRDCDRLGVKPIVISLPSGTTAVQPMTSAIHQGDFDSAMASSTAQLRELRLLGYRPVRLKLEAGPRNRDLPETDAGAAELPDTYYFEHHLKVAISGEAEYDKLRLCCAPHEAHVSSNALKHCGNGESEYFVTVRSYAVGRTTADARIDALVFHLQNANIKVLKRICEYCVHDSNLAIDDGWT